MTEKTSEDYKKDVTKTFNLAHKLGAQDIFLFEGERPAFRVKGVKTTLHQLEPWSIRTFDRFLMMAFQRDEKTDGKIFDTIVAEQRGSYDFNLSMGQDYLRVHMYSAYPKGTDPEEFRNIQAVMNIRIVPNQVPELDDLNLPDITPIFKKKGGLLLVSGRTGEGKSTTVASIINRFNGMTDEHRIILTVEDPVEFVYTNANAWIIQRQVNKNVDSYANATEDALREDADIVVISELRTADEMHNALRLAEVGKLVVASLHANGVEHAVERYVNEFTGADRDITRARLMENLIGIIHQNLIQKDGEQYPLVSMLIVDNEEIREELRKNNGRGKLDKMVEAMNDTAYGMSRADGFDFLKKKGIVTEADRRRLLH